MPFHDGQPALLHESPDEFSKHHANDDKPLWYLAYGSNLSSKTFRGKRGIKPIAHKNVIVRGLQLTFDLPGMPYYEPRFANCRIVPVLDSDTHAAVKSEAVTPDRPWTGEERALIGIAYLVTPADFNRVLATEGGGASYEMIAVSAQVIPPCLSPDTDDKPQSYTSGTLNGSAHAAEVNEEDQEYIEVYTLLAPPSLTRRASGRPSLRYLNLLRDGAREHALPKPYISYLTNLPPYTTPTLSQKLGRTVFISIWYPTVMCLMIVSRVLSINSKDGKSPEWWSKGVMRRVFMSVWICYDGFGKRVFGKGE